MRFIDPDGRKGQDWIKFKASDGTTLSVKYSPGDAVYNVDVGFYVPTFIKNVSIDVSPMMPDAIGLDIGGSATIPFVTGSFGTNLIWHTRGEKEGDRWTPEVHVYVGGGVSFNPHLAANGNAGLLFGWAENPDGSEASDKFVANGMNWTGKFWNTSVALGEAWVAGGATYFIERDPAKVAKGEAWRGIEFVYTPGGSCTAGLGKLGKILGDWNGSASETYYWMVYGNGSEELLNVKNVSGLHWPVSQYLKG